MMADKEFFIYTDRNKLLTPSTTEYRVTKLLKPHVIKKAIQKLQEELNTEGAEFIFKNFDELFSVIEYLDQIDYKQLHYVYENILVKSLNIIGSFFISYGDIEDIDADLRYKYTNIIKMTVYIFIEFVNSFNMKIETDYKLILLQTKGRNKKQDIILKHTSDHDWNWEDKLCDGFKALNSIISNNITKLYDPPYIDHTFVSYIASCCYTQLENPSISFVRTKHLRESIIQILVVLITEYDHAHNFKVKVVQLLKSYEHLSLPLARTVLQVVESGTNRSSLIELIVKEIAETKDLECIKETGNQEITGGKSCCTFFVEIAKHCPQFVLPNIEHLLPCLESDPYSIRTCVLSVLKELIIHVLNNDELDELERKIRDDYFSILQDHLLDINAFVRSKVLQLFTEIINSGCLPKHMYKIIIICAKERLSDKSSYVVKSSILLIKTLIRLNPYSCNFTESTLQEIIQTEKCSVKNAELVLQNKLNSKINKKEMWLTIEAPLKSYLEKIFENNSLEFIYESKVLKDMELYEVLIKIKRLTTLHKFKAALKLILHGRETFKEEPLFKISDENNLSKQLFILLKNIWWSDNTSTSIALSPQALSISEFEQMTTEEIHLEVFALESKIAYLQECVDYLDTVKKAIFIISQLLFGNTTSESLEAIDFFTVAYQFNIPYSEIGVESMILLIHSADPNIKAAVINSYKIIYLKINESDDSEIQVTTIITRLINLIKQLSITKRKAFRVLLNEWLQNKTLNNDCIMLLWSWFTKSITVSYEDRVLSALLLSMISSMNSTFVNGNLENIIKHGLCNDYELFVYSCLILQQNSLKSFDRFTETHDIVNRLINVTQKCFFECEFIKFRDVSSNAINVIYELTLDPDVTCLKLVDELYTTMRNYDKNNGSCSKVNCNLVAKLLFVVGHIALKQYDYLENYIAKQSIKIVRDKYRNNTLMDNENAHNDAEAAEIENINSNIRIACDKLVSGNVGILSSFSKHVFKSCNSDNLELKLSGINTLIKFMLVSTPFCQKHIATFLNIFESADKKDMIISLIISFGWLIFKHPNVLEPYTDKLYAKLKDDCDIIRYSALTTIVDLICQEMIKFRGQSAGIAKLVVDENEQIQNITKFFFKKIAEKGNTLYNVMSDIISILSNPHDAVPESDFQLIMKFLLSFIDKERQIEALVDKLCTRLKHSEDSIQASYISYCLMLLKYTDRSLIKLSDNITLYANQLKNPKVYNNFIVLISINSRLVKPATKEILTDLTDKIEKIVVDEDFATALPLKTPGKRLTTVKRKPNNKNVIKDSSVHEIEPLNVVTKRNSKYHLKVKRRLIMNDSEEENDEELARSSNNNQNTVLKVKKIYGINDNVDVFKRRTTRQTNLACSSKKNLRYES